MCRCILYSGNNGNFPHDSRCFFFVVSTFVWDFVKFTWCSLSGVPVGRQSQINVNLHRFNLVFFVLFIITIIVRIPASNARWCHSRIRLQRPRAWWMSRDWYITWHWSQDVGVGPHLWAVTPRGQWRHVHKLNKDVPSSAWKVVPLPSVLCSAPWTYVFEWSQWLFAAQIWQFAAGRKSRSPVAIFQSSLDWSHASTHFHRNLFDQNLHTKSWGSCCL